MTVEITKEDGVEIFSAIQIKNIKNKVSFTIIVGTLIVQQTLDDNDITKSSAIEEVRHITLETGMTVRAYKTSNKTFKRELFFEAIYKKED